MIKNERAIELARLADRLSDLTSPGSRSPIAKAMAAPAHALNRLERVTLNSKDSSYYSNGSNEEQEEMRAIMAKVRAAMTADMVAEAEAKRDECLRQIVSEIEAIRDAISSACAAAIIEAGQIARQIREN